MDPGRRYGHFEKNRLHAGSGNAMNDTRPREFAQPIADKLKAVIKAELEHVPKELRAIVTDEAISWLAMDFNLWKAKAGRG